MPRLGHAVHQLHKGWVELGVWHGHDAIAQLALDAVDGDTFARIGAEYRLVVLRPALLVQPDREVVEHPIIQHDTPSSGERAFGIAEYMVEAGGPEAKHRDERIHDKVAQFLAILVFLVIVRHNGQNLLRRFVNRYFIGNG